MQPDGKEPASTPRCRTILHLDMDAFFAAVEVLDNPSLAGKPVIVGGTVEGHGVVGTASYEARRYGVRSAMPAAQAVKLCPKGIFLRPRMGRYAAVSREIFKVLEEFAPAVEQVSIDEGFLDLTGMERHWKNPLEAARAIKKRVREVTGGLTSSIGIAPNKFLAKVASDLEKPDGLVVVPPDGVLEFLAPLKVEKLWGVGPRTAQVLHQMGLHLVGDLQQLPSGILRFKLGEEAGSHLEQLARGLDDRPVEAGGLPKSVSSETTLAEFLLPRDFEAIDRILLALCEDVAGRLRAVPARARRVVLKVRDDRFVTLTRSYTLQDPTQLDGEIFQCARSLYRERVPLDRRIRLLGVAASELVFGGAVQLDFFQAESRRQAERMASAVDRIREKLGDGAILRGTLLEPPPAGSSRKHRARKMKTRERNVRRLLASSHDLTGIHLAAESILKSEQAYFFSFSVSSSSSCWSFWILVKTSTAGAFFK